ncbi:MAG: hypothetical protein FWG78_03235 [Coriobacteriia bacterium]|nr:hypothetical protein [Coriobacteriia bacterium]
MDEQPSFCMEDGARSHKRQSKRQHLVTAILIVLLLMLFGTFAMDVVGGAFSRFSTDTSIPRAMLHDEFRRLDDAYWHKNVQVENIGIDPFIVRISTAEFMQWLDCAEGKSGRNLVAGIPFASPCTDDNPDAEAAMAAALNSSTWGVHSSLIDTQVAWFNVEDDMWSIRGLTDTVSLAQAAPMRGHAADGTPFSAYWSWNQPHLMAFSTWQNAEPHERADKWVLCDDGYFYYTSVVEPTQTSVSLMSGVETVPSFDSAQRAYYYAIDVRMEAVNIDDLATMRDGGTTSVSELDLREASGQGKEILDSLVSVPKPLPVPTPIPIQIDTVDFFKIARHGDYSLLITRLVYSANAQSAQANNVAFNTSTAHGSFWLRGADNNTRSSLMVAMDGWYNTLTAPMFKRVVVAPSFTGDLFPDTPTQSLYGNETLTGDFNVGGRAGVNFDAFPHAQSYPTETRIGNVTNVTTNPRTGLGMASFPLSGTEVLEYFPDTDAGQAAVATTQETLGRIGRAAQANHGGGSTTARSWWGRSRGNDPLNAGLTHELGWVRGSWGELTQSGSWGNAHGWGVNTTLAIRPALWVYDPVPSTPAPEIAEGTIVRVASPTREVLDGIPFYRIATLAADDGEGGTVTYDLLVTQLVYMYNNGATGFRFNSDNNNDNFWLRGATTYAPSTLMANMGVWWNVHAGPQLRAIAVWPTFHGTIDMVASTQSTFGVESLTGNHDLGNRAAAVFPVATTSYNNAQSRPSDVPVDNGGANTNPLTGGGTVVFPLSGLEILNYFPDTSHVGNTAAATTSNLVLGRIGRGANASHGDGGTARAWWTRSRGNTATTAGDVTTTGIVRGSWGRLLANGAWSTPDGLAASNASTGLRPALWVRRTP